MGDFTEAIRLKLCFERYQILLVKFSLTAEWLLKDVNKCVSKIQTHHSGVHFPDGGLLPPDLHFRKIFSCATFASQIVCLYLEPLRSYLAAKFTILEKYLKIRHICMGSYMGATSDKL